MNKLTELLIDERKAKRKGGIYHKTQVKLAYNSNRIEGSKLTEEQTRYIFETRTIGFKEQEAVPVDDIIETTNHFVAFDYLIDTISQPLSIDIIKQFHKIIKSSTSDAQKPYFNVGDWKKLANEVGEARTTLPEDVDREMHDLSDWYASQKNVSIETLAKYHFYFESIHPFQDGNGRVGRLILFRECLRNDIVPFVIDNDHKTFYYRGLREFEHAPSYLVDTMKSAQDTYAEWLKYFSTELLNDLHA